jgi:CheY-like chemotaxis protein
MKRILLVEDETVIALAAAMVLEDAGFAVIVAGDGLVGLAKAKSESPDLIVTDYMMPRMDGLALIHALRQEKIAVPIILATAVPQQHSAGDARAPYDGFLRKPFRADDLVRLVRRLIGTPTPDPNP